MKEFAAVDTLIIIGIVIAYILFTTAHGGCAVKAPAILWKARAPCRRLLSA